LKTTFSVTSALAHIQVESLLQWSGTPLSQLNPSPSPRMNRALPKPTLMSAAIVVKGAINAGASVA
jgi:hypothetical protein